MDNGEIFIAQMQIRANLVTSLAESGIKPCYIMEILKEFFIWIPPMNELNKE